MGFKTASHLLFCFVKLYYALALKIISVPLKK
jgi:hypothetical protein